MEPLAIAVRQSPEITGFCYPTGEEKIALYADEALQFLGDFSQSLVSLVHNPWYIIMAAFLDLP